MLPKTKSKTFILSNKTPKQEFVFNNSDGLIKIQNIVPKMVWRGNKWHSKLSDYYLRIIYARTGDNSKPEVIRQIIDQSPEPLYSIYPIVYFDNFKIPSLEIKDSGIFYDNVLIQLESKTDEQLLEKINLKVLCNITEGVIVKPKVKVDIKEK